MAVGKIDEEFKAKVQEDIKKRAWNRMYRAALEDGLSEEEARERADALWSIAAHAVVYDGLFPDGE